MKKILVIEDEDNIRELIEFNLLSDGYEVITAGNGQNGLDLAMSESVDLILLDIMLPEMDGYDVIKSLRNVVNETPVIMLTAKSDEVDKILGLEFGADDYMTKPFSTRELKARIKAVLRRYDKTSTKHQRSDSESSSPNKGDSTNTDNGAKENIIVGELNINVPARELTVSSKPVTLSMKEFDLLKILAENRNRVLTREQLLDLVWGYEYYGETRTVDVHIRYLRKKLGGDENQYIITVRGVGYKMI
jgi:two-component system alkaline phosphatase synthesis response regulator PhoP